MCLDSGFFFSSSEKHLLILNKSQEQRNLLKTTGSVVGTQQPSLNPQKLGNQQGERRSFSGWEERGKKGKRRLKALLNKERSNSRFPSLVLCPLSHLSYSTGIRSWHLTVILSLRDIRPHPKHPQSMSEKHTKLGDKLRAMMNSGQHFTCKVRWGQGR